MPVVVLLVLLSVHGRAQEEHWDTYITRYDNKPASIMLDMGQVYTAPDKKFLNLVVTGPQAQKCDSNSLPDKGEIDKLEEILDATTNFLSGITAKKLVGTFTYNCQRLNYYYVKDTVGIRNALARMYGRNYKDYRYSVTIKRDPEWKIYRTFLYPDGATQNWMENAWRLSDVTKPGDSLNKERDLSFDCSFGNDTSREAFRQDAEAAGFKTKRQTETHKHFEAYAIVLTRRSSLQLGDISKLTLELRQLIKKHNGIYAGWDIAQP